MVLYPGGLGDRKNIRHKKRQVENKTNENSYAFRGESVHGFDCISHSVQIPKLDQTLPRHEKRCGHTATGLVIMMSCGYLCLQQ